MRLSCIGGALPHQGGHALLRDQRQAARNSSLRRVGVIDALKLYNARYSR